MEWITIVFYLILDSKHSSDCKDIDRVNGITLSLSFLKCDISVVPNSSNVDRFAVFNLSIYY